MLVGGIEIEEVAADQNVFRIGCFEDRYTTRTQHAQHFVKQRYEGLYGHVFDDVKTGYRVSAGIGGAAQTREHAVFDDYESSFAAASDRTRVFVDAERTNLSFFH